MFIRTMMFAGTPKKRIPTLCELYIFNSNADDVREMYGVDTGKSTFTKLPNPPRAPVQTWNAVYSPDGNFLVLVLRYAPFLSLFRRDSAGQYTPVTFGNVTGNPLPSEPAIDGVSFTADSKRMVAVPSSTAFPHVYELTEDKSTYAFKSSLSAGNQGTVSSAIVSPDGTLLALSANATRGAYIFKWNGTNYAYFNSSADYGNTSLGNSPKMLWTKDSQRLIAANTNESYSLFIWRRGANDVFTRILTRAITNGVRNLALSPDETHLMTGGASSTKLLLQGFKWDGASTLTALSVTPLPPNSVESFSFTPDGNYLAVGHTQYNAYNSAVSIYARTGDAYARVAADFSTYRATGRAVFRPVLQ